VLHQARELQPIWPRISWFFLEEMQSLPVSWVTHTKMYFYQKTDV